MSSPAFARQAHFTLSLSVHTGMDHQFDDGPVSLPHAVAAVELRCAASACPEAPPQIIPELMAMALAMVRAIS